MTLTQGHSVKVKVTGRKSAKLVSNSYLSYGETYGVLTSHKDCSYPEDIH